MLIPLCVPCFRCLRLLALRHRGGYWRLSSERRAVVTQQYLGWFDTIVCCDEYLRVGRQEQETELLP